MADDASKPAWGVYLLQCGDGTFYCGITNDLDRRLAAHNEGKGAKYTVGRRPVRLLAFSGYAFTRGEALSEERLVKGLPKDSKKGYVTALSRD